MSKLGNSLRMLFRLKTGGIIKAKEIAEELEVTVKEVGRYKTVLEEFFDIESIPGPNGGYKLKDTYFPFKEVLTEEEMELLKNTIHSLDNTLLENNINLQKAINKINYSILNDKDSMVSEQIIPYSRIVYEEGKHNKMIEDIYNAIFSQLEMYISYKDNSGKCSRRRIQPYQYLRYKGERYLVAYCLLRNEIRFFKLARIQDYIITSIKFSRNIDVKKIIEDYKRNSIGIFGGTEYNIVLEITPPMANTISERIWVDNQEIVELNEGKIRFKAIMKGGPEIISWILSMGDCVNIIEPIHLKHEIIKKLNNMIRNMENN